MPKLLDGKYGLLSTGEELVRLFIGQRKHARQAMYGVLQLVLLSIC